MDRIRDLTGTDGADEVLTSTSGGFLDAQYLGGDPPAAALEDHEQPQYLLRNKKAGVTITRADGEEQIVPGSDYQALAVVTDCRVVFLVGRPDGDRIETVWLDGVVEARAESSGFMKSALRVEGVDGTVWTFPCRGDVSPVAAFVDDAAQTWANARRLTDEAGEQVEASREALEEGEFARARTILTDATGKVETARERVATIGDGATAALERETSLLFDRLRQLEQEIAAEKGASHHAAAQEAWKGDHDYERAAAEYERAVDEYERALAADGNVPPDVSLRRRLRGVIREREVLRAAPMADARAAREVAREAEDPDEAADQWETALTCYREAVTLDWGKEDRTFVTDRDRAERRAVEAAEETLDARIEASEEWLAAGDKIVRPGSEREARQAYDRAEDHLERAREVARELAPDRVDDIEGRLATLRRRKRGEGVPPDGADTDDRTATVAASAKPDDGVGTPSETTGGAAAGVGVASERPVGDGTDTQPPAGAGSDRTGTEPTPAIQRVEPTPSSDEGGHPMDGPATDVDDEALVEALRGLDERELTELVADVWERRGWSTTVFSASADAVYDVVAMSEDGEERLLLWTAHRPDGGTVGGSVLQRCATTRDSSRGADSTTLVTTGRLTSATQERAEQLDVTVVDCAALAEAVRAGGLAEDLLA